MKKNQFLIVFAKEPRHGQVKTRLSHYLSKDQTVSLYKAFIGDTLAIARKIKNCSRILAYHAHGNPTYLKKIAPDYTFYRQQGASLGQRLYNAFLFASKEGANKTVIIGSDAPNLPFRYIEMAFRKLSRYDVVFGPSRDGGYYLVGLKTPIRNIFQAIKWSTSQVLNQSLNKARKANKKFYLLKVWQDIDTCADLKRLKRTLKTNKHEAVQTRKFFYGKIRK